MRRLRQLFWLATMLAGCQSSSKAPYADNPLLLSREPLKQAVANSKPATPASVAQAMPPVPPPTVIRQPLAQPTSITKPATEPVANPAVVQQVVATSNAASATPVKVPDPMEVPKPVALPVPPLPTPTIAPSAPSVRYAHAPDHTWLIGEVDVHYRGHKELRFCSITEENAIGGKVRLVDHPQLEGLKAGTHVRIEGELVRNDPTAIAGDYPRYHIRTIQILDNATK